MTENIKKSGIEIKEAMNKQKEVANKLKYPHFAPTDGICWSCDRNIYQNYEVNERTSFGYDGENFITGCCHCNRTFCD